MATQASIDAIQKLYIAFYQRPADVTGLEYWANRADAANGNMSAIVNAFATSAEATANYGSLNTNQLVNTIYTALFGRAPDAAGLNFYSNAIAAGTMTAGQLALNILDGATGSDATIIANKLTVAKAYTTAMDTTAEILAYSNATAVTNAKNLLGAVNALDTSVTNATNQIPAVMVSNVNNAAATIAPAGTTFTFTSSPLDSATNVASATGSIANIQATDSVAGTAGSSDVLTLTTAGAFTTGTGGTGGFERLVLADGANTITMGGAIVAAATANSINAITGGTGYDIVATTVAAQNINLTTVTGIEQFNIANASAATAVAAAALQVDFSGAGANGLIINQAAAAVGFIDIDFGNFINTATVIGSSAASQTTLIDGGTSVDTITIAGGNAAGGTAAAVGTYNFTNVETVNGSVLGGAYNLDSAGANTSGVTFNSAVNTGVQTITGTTLVDTINLSAAAGATGADRIALGSNIGAIDTVANFNAVGNDAFGTGVAATTLTNLTIASADTAGLAAAIATAATAAGATLAANTQAYLITVNAGTAAGTYALQNLGADAAVTAADFLVKLTGTIGAITTADFVV